MIKPKHNFFIEKFFELYTKHQIKKNFKDIKIIGEHTLRDLPILLLSNHISWWDGFWAKYLNMKIFKYRFYFLMLEEQLKRYWYFRYTGGFSIKQNSKSIIESLDFIPELLRQSNNLVLFFPQGRIESLYNENIVFRSGLKRILLNLKNPINIVFQANFIEYLNHKKPTLYIYFSENYIEKTSLLDLESLYNSFLKNSLMLQKKLCI